VLDARKLGALGDAVGNALGRRLRRDGASRVAGGSINECYRWLGTEGTAIFLKVATVCEHAMFEAEAAGLGELAAANAVRVPRVLGFGTANGCAWLALEWLRLGDSTPESQATLGAQLARQHRLSAPAFGWQIDNTIGSTPQPNGWRHDWVGFLRDQRLGYQLDLAARNGFGGHLQERGALLLDRMAGLFATYHPSSSLLHGDLWGGNWATDERNQPVIFDPAVYYGDREADLAMTRLFGGFGPEFYAAYEAAWPLDSGARVRVGLYNLYHVLNHLNLFGRGYLAQAMSLLERLLTEVGRSL
jgi:fructosamine-3-kinase